MPFRGVGGSDRGSGEGGKAARGKAALPLSDQPTHPKAGGTAREGDWSRPGSLGALVGGSPGEARTARTRDFLRGVTDDSLKSKRRAKRLRRPRTFLRMRPQVVSKSGFPARSGASNSRRIRLHSPAAFVIFTAIL